MLHVVLSLRHCCSTERVSWHSCAQVRSRPAPGQRLSSACYVLWYVFRTACYCLLCCPWLWPCSSRLVYLLLVDTWCVVSPERGNEPGNACLLSQSECSCHMQHSAWTWFAVGFVAGAASVLRLRNRKCKAQQRHIMPAPVGCLCCIALVLCAVLQDSISNVCLVAVRYSVL